MVKRLLFLIGLGLATPSWAGATGPGNVGSVLSFTGGQFLFTVTGTSGGRPACATQANRWAIDVTTAAGQALMASVLSAFALGKTITVTGQNTCAVWPDTETVNYVEVLS